MITNSTGITILKAERKIVYAIGQSPSGGGDLPEGALSSIYSPLYRKKTMFCSLMVAGMNNGSKINGFLSASFLSWIFNYQGALP